MDDTKRFNEVLKMHFSSQPKTALEVTRSFLQSHFAGGDSTDEISSRIVRATARNPKAYTKDLLAIEELINDPPAEAGVMADLVAWDANLGLDDPSDEGAKEWLHEVAEMIRDILGENQPPRREAVTTIQH